jgi:methylmalonyl-CoA/ethylmalonyl-CoA epimerase
MPKGVGWRRLDHYSIAVADARKAADFHKKLFGLEESYASTPETSDSEFSVVVLDMPRKQGQVEFLEPASDDSFVAKFLAQRGPGVHHVTIEVHDIERAAAFLRDEMGIEPFNGIVSDGEWKQTFIHPRDSGGVLYQLYEWQPGKRPDDLPM